MNEKILDAIDEAMHELENLPIGGIGEEGY